MKSSACVSNSQGPCHSTANSLTRLQNSYPCSPDETAWQRMARRELAFTMKIENRSFSFPLVVCQFPAESLRLLDDGLDSQTKIMT